MLASTDNDHLDVKKLKKIYSFTYVKILFILNAKDA